MTALLHLSDPHFGTERVEVVAALQRWVQRQRPDHALLSGDITQRARRAQFAAAAAFTAGLGVPVMAVPGNHDIALFDIASRLLRPYARYHQAFGAELEPVLDTPSVLAQGVNTTRWWRHKHGQVSAAQVARVAARLQRATAQQLRIVMVHQPAAVTSDADARDLLRGREAALDAWARAGCDLVLGGHIHLPFVVPVPALARPLWVVQAGTAVSSRVRPGGPNSVHLLRWDGSTCIVEQWDFTGREFEPTRQHALVPAR